VQVERRREGGRGLKDRPEFALVEAFTTAVGEDQRAVEAQCGYGPLQFAGGPVRIRGRQRREALQLVRVGQGQHLNVEPGVSHRGKPLPVQVDEAAREVIVRIVLPLRFEPTPRLQHVGRNEVFFQT
jgi:hypothetical protein